ncbi:unnamed protein product [Phytophthora lilii]|uniref:Unnamed protein product n=1 Tax=Phytophthora lilii TaxID=2077276 RepID=A0A9W6T873_9STRA|nr:unnamed protein product [Phytophthora lilii]
MAVTDESKAKGVKRSHSRSTTKSKKIGRPPHEGTQCSHPGCGNKAQSKGKYRTHTGGGKCSYSGCDKQAQFKGLCAAHGGRRICSDPGCEKKVVSKGKCGDHGGGQPSSRPNSGRSSRSATKRRRTEASADNLNQGSMVSLLLGEWAQAPMAPAAFVTNAQGADADPETIETAKDIVSEVIL